jgi:hypothetical protein
MLRETQQLTNADRTFIMFAIRRVSFPDDDIHRQPVLCTNEACKKRKSNLRIDIGDIPVLPPQNPSKRQFVTQLPSGRVVNWRVLTGADEPRSRAYAHQMREHKVTLMIFLPIVDVDGKPLANFMDLLKWSTRDRDVLRKAVLTEGAGGLDIRKSYINNCPGCGSTYEHKLEPGAGFFLPSLIED